MRTTVEEIPVLWSEPWRGVWCAGRGQTCTRDSVSVIREVDEAPGWHGLGTQECLSLCTPLAG